MSPVVLLTVFGVTVVAELPDKSLFASLVLGTRFRPLWVWLGVTAAFAVHVSIAVAAGGLLNLAPHRVVLGIVAVLFAAGSGLLLFGPEDVEESTEEAEDSVDDLAGPDVARIRRTALAASFGVIFVGEFGDITQITTANFAARYDDPVAVWLGAFLALSGVSAAAITAGRGLLKVVPVALVRRVAGLALGVLAVLTVVELLR